jgi:queuine tRNA-ribosyltransferase
LFKAGEILGQTLLSWHNIAFYQDLMAHLRNAITQGRFQEVREDLRQRWGYPPL